MGSGYYLIRDWDLALPSFRSAACEYLEQGSFPTEKYISDEQIKGIVLKYCMKDGKRYIFNKSGERKFLQEIADFIKDRIFVKAAAKGVLDIYVNSEGDFIYKPSKTLD